MSGSITTAIQFNGGYVWYDVLGVTPSRERTLEEVKDHVAAKWRDDQIASRLQTKTNEMVQKLGQGGSLADEAAAAGSKVETATGCGAMSPRPGWPPAWSRRRFAPPRMRSGKPPAPAAMNASWSRVTDIVVPTLDLASEEIKKMKDTLQRGLSDEQVQQYVTKIEATIGTTINQAAFAQATGANN